MKVFIERTREEKDIKASSVTSLLSGLGFNVDEFLVIKNGSLVTEDELLSDSDEIKILSVISGG